VYFGFRILPVIDVEGYLHKKDWNQARFKSQEWFKFKMKWLEYCHYHGLGVVRMTKEQVKWYIRNYFMKT
jgi:hypothetical protein